LVAGTGSEKPSFMHICAAALVNPLVPELKSCRKHTF
jgi:hypothetical protein